MSVEFYDNSENVKKELNNAILAGLYEAAGEIKSAVIRNTRVKSGKTKGSWKYKIIESNNEAVIGSNDENAIWEEFGTGEHALNGDGRKGSWSYKDEKGEWHFTRGKKPSRAFWKAWISKKSVIEKILAGHLKELNGK